MSAQFPFHNMKKRFMRLLPVGVALALAACSTTKVPDRTAMAELMPRAETFVEVASPSASALAAQPDDQPTSRPAWMDHLDRAQPPQESSLQGAYVPPPTSGQPSLYAESAILIDAKSGSTIFEKNADQKRAVASTQKLLTALLVAERGGLDSYVTTAASDTQVEPSKLGFGPGERYTRRNLLNAMMVKSSNDAASALARDYAGSHAVFAAAMNAKAKSLGAHSSNFVNPHGLTEPGQYSTARDIAKIAFAAYRNPTLRQMMKMPSYTFRFNNGRTATLKATNLLLQRSDAFTGMKTGYTKASGRCLVSSMSYGGRELILVQLGSKSQYIFDDAARVMRWGYDRSLRSEYAAHDAASPAWATQP